MQNMRWTDVLVCVVVVLIPQNGKRKRRGSARLALSRRIEHRCKEAVEWKKEAPRVITDAFPI